MEVPFRLVRAPIEAAAVRARVGGRGDGAVLVFHGSVRDRTDGRAVRHLEYEAYEPMALRQMEAIAADLVARHGLSGLACTHRLGRVEVGEDAMVVAVAAPRRAAALAGVAAFVERLKRDVPIWKKEHFEDGAVWVGTPENPQGEGRAPSAGEAR